MPLALLESRSVRARRKACSAGHPNPEGMKSSSPAVKTASFRNMFSARSRAQRCAGELVGDAMACLPRFHRKR